MPPLVRDALGEALKRRVLRGPTDPLRNRLVRKLLVGYPTDRLEAQFQDARDLLSNWPGFLRRITRLDARAFDAALRPWLAELRALSFLRRERGVDGATALVAGAGRTPEFRVVRSTGEGLAEVKLVSPNDNHEVVFDELEIGRLQAPELFRGRLFQVRAPDDRAVRLLAERAALARLMEALRTALRAGGTTVTETWTAASRRAATVRITIERHPTFSMMSAGDVISIDDDAAGDWLAPYAARVRQRARAALRQMQAYEARVGMHCAEKDIVIYYNEPADTWASLFNPDAVDAIHARVQAALLAEDPTVTLSVRN